MSDFEDKIGALYNQFAIQQKNTKGTKSRADTIENFRGKKGFNDTGIALSSKAIVKQRNNRAGYHYPQHLQNINERRRKDAMARHGITDPDNPFNKKETKPSTQPAEKLSKVLLTSLVRWRGGGQRGGQQGGCRQTAGRCA